MSNRITIVFSIEYNGTQYSGWQKQHNGKSIQGTLEQALCSIISQTLSITGSGRTDEPARGSCPASRPGRTGRSSAAGSSHR